MYSNDLINTVRADKNITHVHFTSSGIWFFNAYESPLGLFGRFINDVPEIATKIVKTETREKILNRDVEKTEPVKEKSKK